MKLSIEFCMKMFHRFKLLFNILKFWFMKKKTINLIIEIVKAVAYALAGYFGIDLVI